MSVKYIRATHREHGTWSWKEVLPHWLLGYLRKTGWVILEITFNKDE